MVNTLKLKSFLILNGMTQKSLAKKIGISENTMSSKINNKSDFNSEEINAICEELKIFKDSDRCSIFLFNPSQKWNKRKLTTPERSKRWVWKKFLRTTKTP